MKNLRVTISQRNVMVFDQEADLVFAIDISLAREIAAALYNDDLAKAHEFADA